ncbi:MAG: urease accessory protein UreE [Verrucomicrobiota bacterium]
MQLITTHFHNIPADKEVVPLKIDRRTLAKRRFRAEAADGADFGFDLDHPLSHHTPFHQTDDKVYIIDQLPESVLKIPFQGEKQAAHYGWQVGNMHFPAAFSDDAVLAEDDPAVRQMLERNRIAYEEAEVVFQPAVNTAGHHHH